MKRILLFLFAASLISTEVFGQSTQTLRIQWEIDGPPAQGGGSRPPFDTATAQSYIYKVYIVGGVVGTALTGVQCTTTVDAFIKACAATMPTALDVPGQLIDMTATINSIETPHSNSFAVPPMIIPNTPPHGMNMIRILIALPPANGTTPPK